MLPCHSDDLRQHALFGAYKVADARHLPRPHAVTTNRVMTMTDPLATLVPQAQWADKHTDHHAAVAVIFRDDDAAQVVEYLSGQWKSGGGATKDYKV